MCLHLKGVPHTTVTPMSWQGQICSEMGDYVSTSKGRATHCGLLLRVGKVRFAQRWVAMCLHLKGVPHNTIGSYELAVSDLLSTSPSSRQAACHAEQYGFTARATDS